jgi:predicted ribosome quality control (RQC) complex YloA/Tae2 family protein
MAMGRGRRIKEDQIEADKLPTGCHLFLSSDGMTIYVGRNSRDNDRLSMRVADPDDFWFHAAPGSGSHVVVRNPDKLLRLPKATLREAAALAVYYSKSRDGGRVAVNYTLARNVSKQRGAPAGQVNIKRFESLRVSPDERPDGPIESN